MEEAAKENKDDEDADESCVFGVPNGDDTCWLSVFCVADEVEVEWGLTMVKEKPPELGGSLLGDENSSDPAFVVVVVAPVVKAEVGEVAAPAPNMKDDVVLVRAVVAPVVLSVLKVPRLKPVVVTGVTTEEVVEGMDDGTDEVFISNWKPPLLGD